MKTLIYLHGFRSSSRSRKAQQLGAALRAQASKIGDWEYITPDLSFDPSLAFAQIETLTARYRRDDLTLIGSSLGGFYAAVCAQASGCRAVLLNPALAPWNSLAASLGPQTAFHGDQAPFEITAEHLAALRAHALTSVTSPEQTLIVVEMGDELLDHRTTLSTFAASPQITVEGGNHDLQSFPSHIPAILRHAGLNTA